MSVWQHTIAAIILQNIDLQTENFYDPFKDDQFGGRVSEIAIDNCYIRYCFTISAVFQLDHFGDKVRILCSIY